MTTTFDFIVIGKGMMGASAARHLAASGAHVALIGPDEPRDRVSHTGVFASHYDNGRITRTIDGDPDWARLARRSIERYREIEARSGIRFYTEVGCLIVGETSGVYLANVASAAAGLGVPVDALDADGLSSRFADFVFAPEYAGIFEARDAGHINPRAFVAAATICAAIDGATIVSEEAVDLEERDGGVDVRTLSGASFRAAKVLIATGGFSVSTALVQPPLSLRVMGRTVLFAEVGARDAERLADLPSLILHGTGEADSFYLLPPIRYPDGKTYIKIGGDPDDIVLQDESAIRSWFRGGGRRAAADHLQRHLARVMPDFSPASVHFSPCVVTMTASGHPYIGMLSSDRVAILTGGNGAAAKSADEIGRLGASLLVDGAVDRDGYAAGFDPVFSGI